MIVKRRAVDPFQRQHFARGAVPVDRRHAEVGVLARVLGHLGERGGLQAEIHLDRDRAGKRRHHFDHAQALRLQREAFRRARGKEQRVEIDLEAALDARAQDFHRHGFAFTVLFDFGAVHLRDRGGGDGGPEARIDGAEWLLESRHHRGLRLALRERRHLVLQAFQIARDGRADHVGPRGKKLAELDVSRPQLGERGGKPAGAVLCRRALDQPRQRNKRLRRQRQRPRIDQREHALACEHETGAGKPSEMGDGGNHNFQPECSATTPAVIGVNETRRKPAVRIISANRSGRGNLRIDSTRY